MSDLVVTYAIFEDLQGCWSLNRTIKGFGAMRGSAQIQQLSPQILEYREEGTLKLNTGGEFAAFRSMFYCRENDDIVVRFRPTSADADILHRLHVVKDSSGFWPSSAHDAHYCGGDIYRGRYCFEAPGKVRILIAVTGPKKNSLIDTLLSKTGACP